MKQKFYGWKLLAVLWLVVLANSFPMAGGSVTNAYMAADLHFSRSTLGLVFATFSWMTGMLGPLVAVCVNRKGVRFTLVLGSVWPALRRCSLSGRRFANRHEFARSPLEFE